MASSRSTLSAAPHGKRFDFASDAPRTSSRRASANGPSTIVTTTAPITIRRIGRYSVNGATSVSTSAGWRFGISSPGVALCALLSMRRRGRGNCTVRRSVAPPPSGHPPRPRRSTSPPIAMTSPRQRDLTQAFRKTDKALTTYGREWLKCIDPDPGHVHPRQIEAFPPPRRLGRRRRLTLLSSSEPGGDS